MESGLHDVCENAMAVRRTLQAASTASGTLPLLGRGSPVGPSLRGRAGSCERGEPRVMVHDAQRCTLPVYQRGSRRDDI